MAGDYRRLCVAECDYIGRGMELMEGGALARQRLGNIYPCEQYCADIEPTEILYHHSSTTGEQWRYCATNSGTIGTAVCACFCAGEGV